MKNKFWHIMLKYLIYLFRWQLSTPILAIVPYLMNGGKPDWPSAIVANLIGGLIFFWFDGWLFTRHPKPPRKMKGTDGKTHSEIE